MSPSGHLCLLSIIGLVLPSRGQMLEVATPAPQREPTPVDSSIMTEVPSEERGTNTDHPELQSVPETSVPKTAGTTQQQTKVPTRLPTRKKQLPTRGVKTDGMEKRGSHEVMDSPFFYDEDTLRKRGLLIAAVLFITGIIILTSGKCRQLSKFCRTSRR